VLFCGGQDWSKRGITLQRKAEPRKARGRRRQTLIALKCSKEVTVMLKRTIRLGLILVVGMMIILTSSSNARAFYKSLCWYPPGIPPIPEAAELGVVEVTSIVSHEGTLWTYIVNNINYAASFGIDFFWVDFEPYSNILTKVDRVLGPNFVADPGDWMRNFFAACMVYPDKAPGLFPGSSGVFTFETEPAGIFISGCSIMGAVYWEGSEFHNWGASAAYLLAPCRQPSGDALISAVSGEVTITTKNGNTLASVNRTIVALDRVKTGPNGNAIIVFSDGSHIELQENSTLSIGGHLSRSWYINEMGKIWNYIVSDPDNDWNISAGNVAVGIRGTTFLIEANAAYTKVSVQSGTVEVADMTHRKFNGITTVSAGSSFQVNNPKPNVSPNLQLLLLD
jgi:hypothetical protein